VATPWNYNGLQHKQQLHPLSPWQHPIGMCGQNWTSTGQQGILTGQCKVAINQ